MISFSRVRYSYASSGEEMSGSLTISINGTPVRFKSIAVFSSESRNPSCKLLPASSSRCTRVMPTFFLGRDSSCEDKLLCGDEVICGDKLVWGDEVVCGDSRPRLS